MTRSSARRVALNALQRWRKSRDAANVIVARLFDEMSLSAIDRGFALEMFYGVLRNLTLLDFWIAQLRRSHVDLNLRDILRLGLYQLLLLETPEHAAVNETVGLAGTRGRELINAVLRTAIRRRNELCSVAADQPLSVRESHPQFLIARWQENFGTETAEALCRWNNQPPWIYGRVNRMKIGREKFLQLYPNAQPVSGNDDFVAFEPFPDAAIERDQCYIQDPSTAIACRVLDPQPGEKLLDACAAPGGKTAYLAERMENRGFIAACDRAPERLAVLDENMKRLGAAIVETFPIDWTCDRVPEKIAAAAPFDRVLVDAPCANTGVMRRRVDVRWRLTPADFKRMQERQIKIVQAVLPLLKPGGVLVYSTCSLEPEENEHVVQHLLAEMSILRAEQETRSLPFRDGFDGAFAVRLLKTR
jgi:16S rRNA (cytosine967-C5)-methyltransferase